MVRHARLIVALECARAYHSSRMKTAENRKAVKLQTRIISTALTRPDGDSLDFLCGNLRRYADV